MAPTHPSSANGTGEQSARIRELRRYTEFVSLSKRILGALALLLVGYIVYSALRQSDDRVRLVFSAMPTGDPLTPRMLKPHYEGVDSQNQPYHITAAEAVQTADEQHIALTMLHADMTLRDTSWVTLTSRRGLFDSKQKMLQLTQDVQMFYEGGYEFRTDSALLDLANSRASGDRPIDGQGPLGLLRADSFEVTEKGKRLYFIGAVKMTIYP